MIAGVYAPVLPGPDAGWIARFGAGCLSLSGRLQKPRRIDRTPIRDFAPCNMAVSRAVWQRLSFPANDSAWESVQAWAVAVMSLGYSFLMDWNFSVRCLGYGDDDLSSDQAMPGDLSVSENHDLTCSRRLVR